MKNLYLSHIDTANKLPSSGDKLSYLTSVTRSILQLTAIVSLEIIELQTPTDEIDVSDYTERLHKPSDGLPIQILNGIIPFLRTYFERDFLSGWFESNKSIKTPLQKELTEWVEFRNKRPAHGVLDQSVTKEWADKTEKLLYNCITVFDSIMPKIVDNALILPQNVGNATLKTPLYFKSHAVVITGINIRKGLRRLKGQLLSNNNAEEFTLELPETNIFSGKNTLQSEHYELSEIVIGNERKSFFHNIPIRQTDIFVGREKEIKNIEEWMQDEDSRYCLIYGDGGYGKTTLTLEFFNRFIESNFEFSKIIPTIISYHTAKKTKWTENGLTHLAVSSEVMDECIRELMRYFHPILPADWHAISGKPLIDKAVSTLKENKLDRNDILLIIDNTETLATSSEEVRELGAFFKTIGKLIGRIVITSRRREFIEATPILIEGLSESEAVRLLKSLAKEYNAKQILQAGEARLRRVAIQLMLKPLLIESLVKYISRLQDHISIDSALENLFKKSNDQLLEFLYEDAWVRMNDLQKDVFFVLVNIKSPLEQSSVSQACQEVGLQHSEFHSGLEETHFGSLIDYGENYSLELVPLAQRFFMQQCEKLDSKHKARLITMATNVDLYVESRKKIEREYKEDRIANAFRNEFAKAARIYVEKNEIENAIDMFELAIKDDPLNPALYDRFAWVLLTKTTQYDYAREIAEKSIELDPKNSDALVNIALITYRIGDLKKGDEYIDMAEKNGRTLSFCMLRKAISRYHKSKQTSDINETIQLLEFAEKMLIISDKTNSIENKYYRKDAVEIEKYLALTRAKLRNDRSKRTRTSNSIN
jgi:tetratricopeptide (TPR) repeat protein